MIRAAERRPAGNRIADRLRRAARARQFREHLVPPPPERLDLRFRLALADGLAPVRRRSADGILDVVEFADPDKRFLGDRVRSGAGGQIEELAADMRPACVRQAPERGMNTKGGESRAETVRSNPAGSTPARQRRSLPAGSESCMGGGNVIREA